MTPAENVHGPGPGEGEVSAASMHTVVLETGLGILKKLEKMEVGDAATLKGMFETIDQSDEGAYDISTLVGLYDEQQRTSTEPAEKAEAKRLSGLAKAVFDISVARVTSDSHSASNPANMSLVYSQAEGSIFAAAEYTSSDIVTKLVGLLYEGQDVAAYKPKRTSRRASPQNLKDST